MDPISLIVGLIIGILLGAIGVIIAWFSLKSKLSHLNHSIENLKQQNDELQNIHKKFNTEFENLARTILDTTASKFSNQNKEQLEVIVNPFTEEIKLFREKVDNVYIDETKERNLLKGEVTLLRALNQKISTEAKNLADALKGNVKVLGNWGEFVLDKILENSGLKENEHYFKQQAYKDEDNKTKYPDIVVSFPDSRNVIIDSKVSLASYERYFLAEDNDSRDKAQKELLTAVEKHINDLDKKKYQEIYKLNSLDFVLMFIPIESAYFSVMQIKNKKKEEVWMEAYKKDIIIVSPTNLIAILKLIDCFWKIENQNKNAQEIAAIGGTLYDQFCDFVDDLENIKKNLDKSSKSLGDAFKKLSKDSKGRKSLPIQAKELERLGARTQKTLSEKMLENDDEDDNNKGEEQQEIQAEEDENSDLNES